MARPSGTFRADSAAAADAVTADTAGWGADGRARPPVLETLQEAVVGRRRLLLEYEGRTHAAATRTVDPWGLVDKGGVGYLVAGTQHGRRTFRVDRIREATMLTEAAARPAGLDLGREWEQVVEEVEHLRSGVAATVLAPARALPVLERQFGRHCELLETSGDGRVRVRLAAHLPLSIAERLAGWGATVEVLEPESVRAELARFGAELLCRYGAPDGAYECPDRRRGF
ncbi:WYL domain-containing protein [Pseudactinotalea sp. Z1732]|uniref:WYL domain-containing protein n=1 Tax=Micrococcales TaxID=85006 RepID=UPI003C7BB0CA